LKNIPHTNVAKTLNCRGRLLSLKTPVVMGILNLTPDSFSDGGEYNEAGKALDRVGQMLEEGAQIIDIGGFSSRPKAEIISAERELERILGITEQILQTYPQALVSVDTYSPIVARQMLELGVHIINDITAGRGLTADTQADSGMIELLAAYGNVPYILMHMQGTPQTMQENPAYTQIGDEVKRFLLQQVRKCKAAGIKDLILDPGFGFGKTILHNHQLFAELDHLMLLGLPLLVGISRKSMLYRLFETEPGDVLELASALHLKAIEAGVRLLRVHDVKEAMRIVELYRYWEEHGII